jgi:predicted Zn finger-like uncharacterized protein
MYTQCPQCQAVFQVTAEHLKAANGDVRCGQCLTVFNALDRLSETVPPQPAAAAEPPSAEELDTAIADADLYAEWASETTAPAPPPAAVEDEEPDQEEVALGDMDLVSADLDEPLAAEAELAEEVIIVDADAPGWRQAEPDAAAETTIDIAAGEAEIPQPVTPTSQDEAGEAEIPVQEAAPAAPEAAKTHVPAVILDDLARDKAEQLRPSGTPWAIGSFLLMLVFAGQAVYFARDQLARDPQLRPWLERACQYLDCQISRPLEIEKIEILGWDVRSSPALPKALVASTTLINNARFPQPFPLLELRFSNMTGTLLAQRRFKPREYLPAGTDIRAGMQPDTPVHVELELMDPGKAAVNFEFHAVADPSTTPHRS